MLGSAEHITTSRLIGDGPSGRLPITEDTLRHDPSGHLFGLTQNAGMGWPAAEVNRAAYLILATQGGLRAADGRPIALGLHTGHWETDRLVGQAATTFAEQGTLPFALSCSDPCDGRTQGTTGMFDSLPYRNDAALTMRRLIRSLPVRRGVLGIGSCDKGLPALLMALANNPDLPGIIVPGGVTLPARDAEDLGTVQSIGTRYAHDLITFDYAVEMGCRACGSTGGGCQFLGTAATNQVVAEALGLALPHSALSPSGEPVWLDIAHRSALALLQLAAENITPADILTPAALENAMVVHAAFGGSTNLLLHIPAIAHAAGLAPPTVADWTRINQATPRLVDVLPNGPQYHPTAYVYMAGGVPEVMLHLRDLGLLHLDVPTVTGQTLGANLDWWASSPRRQEARAHLIEAVQVDPATVIMDAAAAQEAGLTRTLVFPTGNLAPQGAVIKATAIDPSVVDADNVYRHEGPARVFTDEADAIQAIKGQGEHPVQPGDVIVLMGSGPLGTGMQEIYQITAALKHIPWGKQMPLLTDGRFSGVSTGACIGHIGPEALAGGPLGKVRDGDTIAIVIDRAQMTGSIDLVGADEWPLTKQAGATILAARSKQPGLAPHPDLPADTRLWAALQQTSGGTWAGCVYDVDQIAGALES
ncbi:YjhG/YagF family D-xylonate dehydratase [Chloroflexota bacterium]